MRKPLFNLLIVIAFISSGYAADFAPAQNDDNRNLSQQIAIRDSVRELQQQLKNLNDQIADYKQRQNLNNQKLSNLIQQVEQKNAIIDSLRQRLELPMQDNITARYREELEQANVKSYYNSSLDIFREQEYKSAANHFILLLTDYSEHDLAGNFAYWAGESYYGMEKYQKALKYFKMVSDYPNSPKNDDALIMSGQALLRMGRDQDAQDTFQTLLEMYPNSEYANLAQDYIK